MGDTREPFDDLFEPIEGEPAPAPAPQVQMVPCPSCGTMNAANSRHCISCGARVAQGPLPMAPQPLVRSTAGSRALIVTAAVIAVVVVIALFYNAFVSDDEPAVTTAANGTGATTTSTAAGNGGTVPTDTVELTANRVVPSAQLSGFPADNLIDSDPLTMWQVGQEGVGATLTFFFPNPVALERIEIKNISDETKFRQNFRVRGIRIRPNDTTRDTVVELANTRDVQPIAIQTEGTTTVRVEVTSTFPAEAVGDQNPFKELAIEDIKFFGSVVSGG
ncbi:MAG: zinc ribbon domain-containing protein [Acidimicrobiia bacterium]|nr:zinc ribbon domain-containing protein [Acidimicrobiia bacterium]